MRFDWHRFCIDHGVDFITKGRDLGQGKIGIRCPFCDDRGEHLGMSLDHEHPWWKCWRCHASGRFPQFLICKLLGVARKRADEIVAEHGKVFPDEFDNLLIERLTSVKKAVEQPALELPRGCHELWTGRPGADRFLRYLSDDRGFGNDARDVAECYALHYAMVGEQAWRIVFPVVYGGELVAWVGRSIHAAATLRYKADDAGAIKDYVSNYDELVNGADKLAMVEGPMDWIKLDYYGQQFGLRATCTFGVSPNEKQSFKLRKLVQAARRGFVIYDREASAEGFRLADELSATSGRKVATVTLSLTKDPGAMTPAEIRGLASNLEKST